MANNINFFGWIRAGVKQSVLLGVSDAIETIGAPDEPEKLHPQVAALLMNANSSNGAPRSTAASSTPMLTAQPGNTQVSKKRLGRSLKDIDVS